MKNLTAADRDSLIRLAASLPKGDESRRAILSGLTQTAAPMKSLHPMLAEGDLKFVRYGELVASAIKSAMKPQAVKDSFILDRKVKRTLARFRIYVWQPSTGFSYDVTIQYSKDVAPSVILRHSESSSGGTKVIPIPTSAGVNPDGTIAFNATDPGKLIKFLLGYLKDHTLGRNLFKGDEAGPDAAFDEAKKLSASVFLAFKKLAKSSGIDLGSQTSNAKHFMMRQMTPSKWQVGNNQITWFTEGQTNTLRKAWEAVVSKFAAKMEAVGLVSGYIPPVKGDGRLGPDRMNGSGVYTLEVI